LGKDESMQSVYETHGRMGEAVAPEPESAAAYTKAYAKYSESVNLLTPHFTKKR